MEIKTIISKRSLLWLSGLTLVQALSGAFIPLSAASQHDKAHQYPIQTRAAAFLYQDGLEFKDLNKNEQLDSYEDWRLPVATRVADLVNQMTLKEKVGMMMIDTLNADWEGTLSDKALQYIQQEKMTRFIFRNLITDTPDPDYYHGLSGKQITPFEAASFMNRIQQTAEATRLGIPVLFKSNARNHYAHDPRAGVNSASGAFSAWPKEPGLAATRDMELIGLFADSMAREWLSLGIRGMYGYMADLATEPRWYRVHETFSEDADLTTNIIKTLINGLQGPKLNEDSITLTMKHFPGGGPQQGGRDPHYRFGQNQVYPAGQFDYHLQPFQVAIDAGLASLMPYYGIPVDQGYSITLPGEDAPRDVGISFSKGIITDLLRDQLGFQGVVNSDTGIIGDCTTKTRIGKAQIEGCRAWGLEDKSIDEQLAIAINAGTDVLSGFHDNAQILNLVESGKVSEARINQSVARLLTVQFKLGLFENPYLDPHRAERTVGHPTFKRLGEYAQRKSIVLLQNQNQLLPLPSATSKKTITLYTMGLNPQVVEEKTHYKVIAGDYQSGEIRPTVPENIDYALIRVIVNNDNAHGDMFFGGANEDEIDLLAFSDMATANSWKITPSLDDIQAVMNEVGAEKTILAIYFRQPYVLDTKSQLNQAGSILATFGVKDDAIMDIVTGRFNPTGRLPFALANSAEAIVAQDPDAPGYAPEETLYPFGFGLSF